MGDLGAVEGVLAPLAGRAQSSRDVSQQMHFTNDSYIALVKIACSIGKAMAEGLRGQEVSQLRLVKVALEELDSLSTLRGNEELLVSITSMKRIAEAVRQRWSS